MKKMFKFGCLGTIGLVVLLAILGAMLGTDETTDTATETKTEEVTTDATTTTETEEVVNEPAEEKKEEVVGLGTPKSVGAATFTLNGVAQENEVGNQFLNSTAQGVYLILNVTYQNNSNEATTVDTSFFKLKYGEKTYEADSSASMYANSNDDGSTSFFLEQVNPDMSVTGQVVFDVTEEVANATGLQLQVQTGFWGTETGLISVQ